MLIIIVIMTQLKLSLSHDFDIVFSKFKQESDTYTKVHDFTNRFEHFKSKFERSFASYLSYADENGICEMTIGSVIHKDVKEEMDKLLKDKGFTENKELTNVMDYYFCGTDSELKMTKFYVRKYKKFDIMLAF
jgi:hypothetical protein